MDFIDDFPRAADFFDEAYADVFDGGKFRAVAIPSVVGMTALSSSSTATQKSALIVGSSSQSRNQAPSKPTLLSKTHFYAKISSLIDLTEKVAAILSKSSFESTFSQDLCQWSCKSFDRDLCEFSVSVFWDVVAGDHIVELKRLRGAPGQILALLFNELQSAILGQVTVAPKKTFLLRPLPVAAEVETTASSEFIEGCAPIFKMVHSSLLDMRTEGAKMLLSVAQMSHNMLSFPACVDKTCAALRSLLVEEESEEVKLIALSSLESLLQLPAYQKAVAAQPTLIECLVGLFTVVDGTATLQQKSQCCLSLLSKLDIRAIENAFVALGFSFSADWLQRVA